ncbi:TlpA disulfide reductase family protein [Actinopolymorpha singaporensis]|uniref:Thiol-disulfide isomerase or thioredoxin n=1 Tax=Actinopolymorpha singaporensis TaxID=117157 RepID=A0A1H1QP72_9ACTN|nr:TlpA disulfide reductase family protein [Actinopolymorpha singaporensis]SDS25234.1 Thiol-disulfide isomerase or thioredoxin [Actinopolymorpha singaporensis]
MGSRSPRHPRGARSRALAAVATLALLGVAGLAGCSGDGSGGGGEGGDGSRSTNATTRFVSGSGTVTTMPPDERRRAPAVAGTTLDGKRVALADYRGKVVVLNVWGSWCAPCRKEAPDLAAAARALRAKGVEFLGINTRDVSRQPAQAFVRTFDVPYPSIYDPNGEQLLGFRATLPPSAIPSTLVIDKQGRVAARVLGNVSRRTLEQLTTDVTGLR